MLFTDRFDAGKKLAVALQKYKTKKEVIILAIPRGALQIGAILAGELHAPLDVFVAKKISMPRNEEVAIGAVAQGGIVDLDARLASLYNVPKEYLAKETERLRRVVDEKYKHYAGRGTPPLLKNKIVILCDDGIATGHTVMAAVKALRKQKPKKVIVAVPVASAEGKKWVASLADEVVVLATPEQFFAIGQFYSSFPQVEDEEAIALLTQSRNATFKSSPMFKKSKE